MKKLLRSIRMLPVAVVLLFALNAQAAIIPEFLFSSPNGSGGFTYFYEVALTENSRLDPASPWAQFFTIFDFDGFIPGSDQSSNPDFAFSSQLLGLYNNSGAPVEQDGDSAGSPNLSWIWNGNTVIVGPITLGIFQADSLYSGAKLDAFQGQDTKNAPGTLEDGQRGLNEGSVTTPEIPEPGTYALLGGGLLLLGLLRKRLVRS